MRAEMFASLLSTRGNEGVNRKERGSYWVNTW
jgi:hypothetical protein